MTQIDISSRISDVELTVLYQGKPTEINLGADLLIDPDAINENFIDQPAKFAWWGVMCNYARQRVDRLKHDLTAKQEYQSKTLRAILDRQVREELEAMGEKVTESKVEMGVYASQEYQASQQAIVKLREELLEADHEYNMLQTAVAAMNQRKDMLISLGANMRAEWDNTDLKLKGGGSEARRQETFDADEAKARVIAAKNQRKAIKE